MATPATLNAGNHPDYRSSYLEVYISICSRVGTKAKLPNFCTCFPSIDSIAQKFKHSRMTVIEATNWLETEGYLLKERQQRASNLYTIILRRDWFLEIRKAEGDDVARERYKAWIREQQAREQGKKPGDDSGTPPASHGRQQFSGYDFKSARPVLEVPVIETSEPTGQKSQPLHLDLDLTKTITKQNDAEIDPELPSGPFYRGKIFD